MRFGPSLANVETVLDNPQAERVAVRIVVLRCYESDWILLSRYVACSLRLLQEALSAALHSTQSWLRRPQPVRPRVRGQHHRPGQRGQRQGPGPARVRSGRQEPEGPDPVRRPAGRRRPVSPLLHQWSQAACGITGTGHAAVSTILLLRRPLSPLVLQLLPIWHSSNKLWRSFFRPTETL